ncbi:MAG: hypothetical protein JW837_00515 [Sedimentisphaerales bacterium]|nr:hypothetical protein [Sedimentisphaerales bacterium]
MSDSLSKSSGRMSVSQSCSQDTIEQHSSRGPGWFLRGFFFFVLFYLYLWLYVDLRLIYHGAGIITNFPVFYKGRAFFLPFLSYPGGPVEYLSAFLAQLFYYSWVGAIIVTLQAWLLSGCADYLLKTVNLPRIRRVCFILPILVLVIYTRYAYYFDTIMALSIALLVACVYVKATLSRTSFLSCSGTFLLLSVVLYYLAGGVFLLFALVCVIYELIFRFRRKMSLFYLLSAAVIPYVVGLLVFRVSIIDAFSNLLPFSWKILSYEARNKDVEIVYILYLVLPLTLFISGFLPILRKRLRLRREQSLKKRRKKSSNLLLKIFSRYRNLPKLRWAVESLLLLAVAGSIVFFCRDENLRTRFKVDYYAYHKMWPELLTCARHNPHNPVIAHEVNRALYNVGRLGYDMFSWPQHPDYLFLSDMKHKWMYWQIFGVFLDIGVINIAENALTECLEGLGSRPMVLQKLALINMVKGNSGSARIYLGALSKTLFDSGWAKHYLELLRTDPELSSDKYIQHMRSIRPDDDCLIHTLLMEKTLLGLLDSNSNNRMAFEYLMARYMLKKHIGKLVQNFERLQDLGYSELPTHYQEAALIYVYGTRNPLNIGDYRLNPLKRQEIEDFSRLLADYKRNNKAASGELSKKYRNTYFFYYKFASTGQDK